MADVIQQEAFEYSLRNFLEWLRIMTLAPAELCEVWGNYNVARELVSDLRTDGESVVSMPCSYLSAVQKQVVEDFLESLQQIPQSILVSTTSASANLEAMSNACWVPYRSFAAAILDQLHSAYIRNNDYFLRL
jgi:uncharacterized alpha-E superfamily protein